MQEPTWHANNHSIKVVDHIKQKIYMAGGSISFADFMQSALYAPNLGYYNAGCEKFGKHGDFITAPMLGELFSFSVATQCSDILNELTNHNILELGAGDGQLAYQLIKYLTSHQYTHHKKIKLDNYFILEPSAELQVRQKKMLLNSNLDPFYKSKISWISTLPEHFTGIILANEVFDALPVHLFKLYNKQILEKFVIFKDNKFDFIDVKASENLLNQILKLPINRANDINNTYESEICLLIPGLIKSLSLCLQKGAILLFDYGFLEHEYYHQDRNNGTLMCHYQHHAHPDPFFLPGLQDITAHVNFSMIIDCAIKNNLQVAEFSSLANFLINNGLEQEFKTKIQMAKKIQEYKLHQEINTLISPSEMGEIFKVLLLKSK